MFFFPLYYPLSSFTLGGPALRLNFGPSSELGVNEGVVPLLLVCFRVFIYKFSPFSFYDPVSFYFTVSGLAPPYGDISVCDIKQGTSPFVGPLPSPSMVVASPGLAKIEQLSFFDRTFFRAGKIHNHLSVWERLLSGHSSSQVNFIDIVREGVKIDCFFKPFKGNFKGCSYDTPRPPSVQLSNSKICGRFQDFISETVLEWVTAGVLDVWGRVGQVTPPYLVLPLTVEPSKPRLCHDERYLNLWIRDLPFPLDHLPDLPRYLLPWHFQTSFDDKSGYQHVLLHSSSRTYFRLEWGCGVVVTSFSI